MKRREFLARTSLTVGAGALAPGIASASLAAENAPTFNPENWQSLRQQFPLTRDYIHLATFLLASHPKSVADAIERHRRALDANPVAYLYAQSLKIDKEIASAAASYMGGDWQQIALTDSTTMGLAMVYSGLQLAPDDEILSTVHDHYSTENSLKSRAERTGAKVRHIALYDNPASVSVDEVVSRLLAKVTKSTRAVAVTWVHSSTGVKLPVRAIADSLEKINQERELDERVLLCVDGVHGFGVEDADISVLGCDFFIAGTHKWIFGPRGTGVIWGTSEAWARTESVIPAFGPSYAVWLGSMNAEQVPPGQRMTPGGFHSFEHRYALPEAFNLHLALGKDRVQKRIHELNTRTKQGLASMKKVKLHTPMNEELSSGLVCFEVEGLEPNAVVEKLYAKNIIMSSTPYRESYARFAPSLINNEEEIDQALAEIAKL